MSRSACLPEAPRLRALLDGLRRAPAATNGRASNPWRSPIPTPDVPPPPTRPSGLPERPQATFAPEPETLLAELDRRLAGTLVLEQRFEALVHWLEVSVPARQVFVADGEGLAMVESSVKEGYLAAAGGLGVAFSQLSALVPELEEGSTTLRLRGSANVELVGCTTELGRFNVGLVLERPLGNVWISIIRAALDRVAQSNGSQVEEA